MGKTGISIELAKILATEVISGDSMLVFRGMDIGSAKPDIGERKGIPHHLIDILEPEAEFSVVDFCSLASKLITKINYKSKLPVLAGGTGLYVKALLEGYKFSKAGENPDLRQELTELAMKFGNEFVHAKLTEVQPETAARLHPNNLRRVIRALEVYYTDGDTVSQAKQSDESTIYNSLVIGLTMPRALLYDRINHRVEQMIANGLIEEIEQLLKAGISLNCQSMQGIGYKEIALYLTGQYTIAEAIDRTKQVTRNFAKRQLTWFKKMPYIHWIDVHKYNNAEDILAYVSSLVAGKFYN